ncbi:MAG: RES family NAD+ phosphorylase [Pseudomonadales bacterium]|nr:RES family NAD+ phosphorylase [Pseudomonadales bacterium]
MSDYNQIWINGPQYRIIPTKYPPINFFERYTPPELMEEAFEIETMTNERVRLEVGDLGQVAQEDRISGPGASIVMAAFTHCGFPSRFTNGDFGIYYAALKLETAIKETAYHRERFLGFTEEPPCEIEMRVYKGTVSKPLLDITSEDYQHLMNPSPDQYQPSQQFGAKIKAENHWGILYPSVRHKEGLCLAAMRPPTVSIPVQSKLLAYHWNGERIATVYEKKQMLINFESEKEEKEHGLSLC